MTTERPSSAFQTENIDLAKTGELVDMLDLHAKNIGVRRLREWAHSALAARSGERAVDVGSGTGSETHVLALAVGPRGEATGVEPNPGLRAVARQRSDRARFVDGDATALPFESRSVDLVWCERVFQYLSDPDVAAGEIARVLRPGGRVALIDTDWGTAIIHPGEPAVAEAVARSTLRAAANPHSGRKLAGQLVAAGLRIEDIGSQALVHDHTNFNWPFVRMLANAAEAVGEITSGQRDAFLEELRSGGDAGALHMSVTMYAVVARRM
jgi:SAM-dependent methyltransferase